MKGFPYKSFPTGWYQVGWSHDLAPGEVRSLRIFDREVVLYRAEGGAARLVDAVCPHLGADLGKGGSVTGDCLACPFHGWEYGLDGVNTRIPFLERSNSSVRLTQWDLREVDGILITWFDELGRSPHWEWRAPEFADRERFSELSCHDAGVRKIIPHQPIENGPDVLHFPFVHGAGEPAEMVSWQDDDHVLRVVFTLKFGVGKDSSLLTPDGPSVATLESEGFMSLGLVRFTLGDVFVVQLVSVTPVDHEHSMVFSTTTGRLGPDGEASEATKFMMEVQHPLVEKDFNIWENQTFIERPPYAGIEEKYFLRFRKWLQQFYPDADGTPVEVPVGAAP